MQTIQKAVSREDVRIARTPPQKLGAKGGLYRINDPSQGRIHGSLCLVHDDHVVLENSGGGRDDSLCRVEALVPERGHNDYCLFWVEKKQLEALSAKEYTEILAKLNVNLVQF